MSAQGFLFGYPFKVTEAMVRARPSWQPLIVGCGGGQNTGGVLAELKARGIRPDAIVMADTGGTATHRLGELPETYEWLERHLQPWLKRAGFPPLTLVYNESPRSGHRSLYDECMTNGVLPGKAYGNAGCTIKWKVQPLEKWVRSWAGAEACYAHVAKPIKALGYDASAKDVDRAERMGDEDRLHAFWFPAVEYGMDRRRCIGSMVREGLAVPIPSMCGMCPSRRPRDILAMRARTPFVFDAAVALENNAVRRGNLEAAGDRFSEARALDLLGDPVRVRKESGVRGLGRDWSWRELVDMNESTLRALQALSEREDAGCVTCAVDAPRSEEACNDRDEQR